MIASNRQFEDDLAYARQRAVADHTSVYVVFVPPTLVNYVPSGPAASDVALMTQYTNLLGSQYTTYALVSLRLLGEQPGRATPHYLTPWRNLPNGVFIARANFVDPNVDGASSLAAFPTATVFPFPNATNFPGISLPYIGFDYQGRLTYADGITRTFDAYIPLARGSIFYARNPNGGFVNSGADVQETPPNNSVTTSNVLHINALTGRVKLETLQVQ